MTAALVVQKAIRTRLVNTPAVTALVPAAAILDRNERPSPDPSIILGEDQIIDPGDTLSRIMVRVFSTLHVWKKEAGLIGVKGIAGAIASAIKQGRLALEDGFHCADCRVADQRFLRDPDGSTAHGVVTIETVVEELV